VVQNLVIFLLVKFVFAVYFKRMCIYIATIAHSLFVYVSVVVKIF